MRLASDCPTGGLASHSFLAGSGPPMHLLISLLLAEVLMGKHNHERVRSAATAVRLWFGWDGESRS
jgi:hypothetical protein